MYPGQSGMPATISFEEIGSQVIKKGLRRWLDSLTQRLFLGVRH